MKRVIFPFLLTFLLTGCLNRSQPDIARFLLGTPTLSISPITLPYTVKVLSSKVAAPYAGHSFIYRLNDEHYESDFYHRFLSNPSQMLTVAMTAALSQSNLFKNVIFATNVQESDLLLEASITELYADYRSNPTAVLTLQAYLSYTNQSKGDYLVNHTIRTRVPIRSKSAASYVKALNQALAQSLEQLQEEIRMSVR